MIDPKIKKWIDEATYEQLLKKWRNEPCPSPFFDRETGVYYREVMTKKRTEVGHDEHVRASKAIGFEGVGKR